MFLEEGIIVTFKGRRNQLPLVSVTKKHRSIMVLPVGLA
jgi:hypothetical protein